MSWHFLQGQEEASWEENSLDGAPSALLSLLPIQDQSYLPGKETECLTDSQSGTTLEPFTGNHGEERLMSSVEGSHVKTLAQLVRVPGLTENDQDFGKKWPVSLAKYDLDSHSWKTHQCSLAGDLEQFSETWPRWGIMQDGECWELTTLEPVIEDPEYGYLPTPQKSDGKIVREFSAASAYRNRENGHQVHVPHIALMKMKPLSILLSDTQSMMGWPESWTSLRPLEMDKFQQWLDSHGKS